MREAEAKANLEKWKCTQCGRQMKSKQALNQHKYNHQKPYNCLYQDCEKQFARQNQMMNHLKNRHRKKSVKVKPSKNETKVPCSECSKEFSHKENMKAHFKRKHEGKTYDCEKCNKKFSSASAKKGHVNAQHGNGKPFQCNTCNKGFSFQQGLLKHLKSNTHEKVAGKK